MTTDHGGFRAAVRKLKATASTLVDEREVRRVDLGRGEAPEGAWACPDCPSGKASIFSCRKSWPPAG